jgi:hypothetical protein
MRRLNFRGSDLRVVVSAFIMIYNDTGVEKLGFQ